MIKGLVITPPVLGRISIGKIVEKNGKRLPEKDVNTLRFKSHSLYNIKSN